MERYEAYKDSGVEWIGELPIGWEVMKLKYIASLKTGYTPSKEKKENYSDNGITWVKPNDLEGFSPVVGSKEKVSKLGLKVQHIVPKGSLLVCCIGSIGKFGIAGSLLITNQQINALVFNNFVTDAFSKYLIAASISEHQRHANGNVVKILNTETQGSIFFPIPPKPKQTAIANFLDRKTAEIDALIAQKERLLGLYEEEKTAIINHAVTKGLDPNAELKDSGVEWLGEIPDGWDELPLKRVSDVVLGKMLCSEDKGGYHEKPYLRAKNITWLKVDQNDIKRMWFSSNEISQYRLEAGDLLVSEGGEVGRTCIWNNEIGECYIQNSVHRVRFRTHKDSRYYLYLFYCLGKIGVFDAIVNRISIAHLTKEKLQQVLILKPRYNQQTAIANFLDRKMTEIDAKIAKTQRIIELQKEYRTALISEAVTGKIKVPELPTQEASA